jgi:hypothetical protein
MLRGTSHGPAAAPLAHTGASLVFESNIVDLESLLPASLRGGDTCSALLQPRNSLTSIIIFAVNSLKVPIFRCASHETSRGYIILGTQILIIGREGRLEV